MEALCTRGDIACGARALTAALHSLHIYCGALVAALISCCGSRHPSWQNSKASWRGQDIRGCASLVVGVAWCCDAASSLLRPAEKVRLVAALLGPVGWVVAAWFHVALWSRRAAAPLLYLAIYWALSAASSIALLWQNTMSTTIFQNVDTYLHTTSILMALVIATVDCVCFYDEVSKRFANSHKSTTETHPNVGYKHNEVHFYSKITFFWLNSLLYRGYEAPLEQEDLGELSDGEQTVKHYNKFKIVYASNVENKTYYDKTPCLWGCYTSMVWPNFYLGGVLKLFGDIVGVVPPLGLAVIIQYVQGPALVVDVGKPVSVHEFYSNGYVMLLLITLALIAQALLSQNSTHLVTVEGTRLKSALQAMIYDKCMRLAPWTYANPEVDEESPLLHKDSGPTQAGLLTNLVAQDTYNIMSCVWICHYMWAIPMKVSLLLYLLYTKLGTSAILGTLISMLFITPLQFLIGKKISDNSKDIAKCTDHRISKMSEILQGINVIKLYVWEDLFKEKILNLREVELKLLYKDTVYWNFLTFSTQLSTILVTVITFIVYYFLNDTEDFTAVNVFAALALFNQLTIPLLILPVTVLMVIQATVSTQRIKEFLELPESNNVEDEHLKNDERCANKFNDAFVGKVPNDRYADTDKDGNEEDNESDNFSENDDSVPRPDHIVKFRNASFTWGLRNDSTAFEVDDLDIPTGKLIMVVGPSGSGKSSLLSAILGEMYLDRGDVIWNGPRSVWYSGQPPWLVEGTVRDNITMGSTWCQRRYARVLRATGLRPDLQLLPDGDSTVLGSRGTPLSGGQRVRVCMARALYSRARLVVLDEPLAALDAPLARHVVARGLVPTARSGRTVLLATNRLELMHYADLVLVMEEGRVTACGRVSGGAGTAGALGRWGRLAAEARAATARVGAGPPGGVARERSRLVRALSKARLQRTVADDSAVGISEVAGAHLLAEVSAYGRGSWRRAPTRSRPTLSRQLSSPPAAIHHAKYRRDVRRVVSADGNNTTLQREASFVRRLLRPRPSRTLASFRWTPRPLRRLLSPDSEAVVDETLNNGRAEESVVETTYTSMSSNGIDTAAASDSECASSDKGMAAFDDSQWSTWCSYVTACGRWGGWYVAAAAAAQACSVAADCWLASTTHSSHEAPLDKEQMWRCVQWYVTGVGAGAVANGAGGWAAGRAAAKARRELHERLLHSALHAPLSYHHAMPLSAALHRAAADVPVIDKKLPTAITRWAQLALLCLAATLVIAAAAPWSLLVIAPAFIFYLVLQAVYLRNARELQRLEAYTAGRALCRAREAGAGGRTVRLVRLQPRLRGAFLTTLDDNHNALLILHSANRWLGLTMDLVGAAAVCTALGLVVSGVGTASLAGLAGAYSLLLPTYLAHLAKCRADLDMHLAAVERVQNDINAPQEDYREDCPIPGKWERKGRIEFDNVSVQHEPGAPTTLDNITINIASGEKVAICGRSGSGKSTLLASCVGAARVLRGRVTIDGVDASHVPLRVLRHRIVVLPQEAIIFSGTLRENLDPLGVHTDQEIWHSLKIVGLQDFVAAQPAGLECVVWGAWSGWGACGWGAGRAARACAARALLRAPLAAAVLLDEPAAALDAHAEGTLLAAVANAAPNTTILTVAHRISSIRNYDRALVLDRGRIVEQGSPTTLLAQPTSRLARMQAATQRDG